MSNLANYSLVFLPKYTFDHSDMWKNMAICQRFFCQQLFINNVLRCQSVLLFICTHQRETNIYIPSCDRLQIYCFKNCIAMASSLPLPGHNALTMSLALISPVKVNNGANATGKLCIKLSILTFLSPTLNWSSSILILKSASCIFTNCTTLSLLSSYKMINP